MFGSRGLVTSLTAGYFLLGLNVYSVQSDPGNETSYQKTYRPGFEKYFQSLLAKAQSNQQKGSSERNGESADDRDDPLELIIDAAENVTKRTFSDFLNIFEKHFHLIFPGTLWCGPGNISRDGDLGLFYKTDACCRAHDECPSDISAGQTKGDLINNGAYTRSACSCDHQFYSCLKNASSPIADDIGWTYFDILGPQCFEYNYPTTSCAKYGKRKILKKPCVEYNYDTSKNKTLIWVDDPVY